MFKKFKAFFVRARTGLGVLRLKRQRPRHKKSPTTGDIAPTTSTAAAATMPSSSSASTNHDAPPYNGPAAGGLPSLTETTRRALCPPQPTTATVDLTPSTLPPPPTAALPAPTTAAPAPTPPAPAATAAAPSAPKTAPPPAPVSTTAQAAPAPSTTAATPVPVQTATPPAPAARIASLPAPKTTTPPAPVPTTAPPAPIGRAEPKPASPAPTPSAKKAPAPSAAPAASTPAMSSPTVTASSAEKALTAKEVKDKKKAEKAARRQQTRATPTGPSTSKQQQQGGKKQKQDGPVSTIRLGTGGGPGASAKGKEVAAKEVEVVDDRSSDRGLVGLLKDLESEQNGKKKKPVFGTGNAHPDVHPAILTLGMQIHKRVLCGSSARCLAFLLAIRRVIEDYETPEGSSLHRHLPGAYFSHQINFLISARPMATAMGNTIRWLKTEICKISPDLTDEVAKRQLVCQIDNFIHERLTAADEMIINTACTNYIEDGDVIVTFAKSQVVEKTLLEAKRRGKNFRVIVVDGRPLEEGRNLLRALCEEGIECSYIHLYALDYMIQDATKVLLGAHAMMADGALYSRAGTAVVAAAAESTGVPVLVLCETIKFSDKINIDGIVGNELGPPDLLVNTGHDGAGQHLAGWRDVPNTTVVSFMYDVTPAESLSVVICEHGCVNPEGVPSILRVSGMDR